MDNPDDSQQAPRLPSPTERMDVLLIAAPHPSIVPDITLLSSCELRTQRRSGPGGQHRNKTSSGVFLTYLPTDTVSEATERRSQADNRVIAAKRLRYRLATEVRTPSNIDEVPEDVMEMDLRKRYAGHSLKLNENNKDKPGVLALLLNDMHAAGGQPSAVSKHWRVSTSKIIQLLKSYPPAFGLANQIRRHHGRRELK